MAEKNWLDEQSTVVPAARGSDTSWLDGSSKVVSDATEEPSLLRSVGDSAIAFGSGVTQGVGMLANVAGADNPVSRGLDSATKALTDLESPYRKAEKQARAQKIADAEKSGSLLNEVGAYAGSFAEAPIDTTLNALGTSLPTLAAGFFPGGQAALAARAAQLGLGAAQGVGAVKGQIYDEVEKAWKDKGASPENSAARAAQAQSYSGDNAGMILAGGALGAAAGSTGAEGAVRRLVGREVAKDAAESSILKSAGMGALKESPMEMLQGGQERLASNIALQNEGFDQPTWQGVAGQAALEGLASAPMGAGFGALEVTARAPAQTAPDTPPAQPTVQPPVVGPTLALPAPDRGVIQVAGDGTARTPAYQAPGYVGDVTDVEPRAVNPVREQVAAAAEQGGSLSNAALTAIDTGVSDAMQPAPEQAPPQISLEEADARDRAAYEQFFAGFDADPVVSRYFENDDDIPDFDAASNASEEDFLRALGATDEDIQDAIATSSQSAIPQSSVASNAGPQAYEPAGPREGAGEGAASQAGQVNAGAIQQAAPDAPVPGVGGAVGADGAGSAATAVSGASGPGGAGTGAATGSGAGATEVGSARAGGRGDGNQALSAPANLRDALVRVRQQKQEAANAQAAQAPAPAAAPVPGPAAATTVEASGVATPESPFPTTGVISESQTSQAQQASPQPTQAAAAPAAAAGLTDGAPTANTGAQAAPAAGAQGAAPAEPEFTTIKTVYGDSVTVRTADLNSDKPRLRQYTKDGKSKAVPAIHRDNLDLTGDKRAANAKEDADNPFFNVITTKDGSTFANQAAASRELNRLAMGETHEVVAASEVQDGAQGFVIRRKLADAMDGRVETGGNQAAEPTMQAQAATENVASNSTGQDEKSRWLKSVADMNRMSGQFGAQIDGVANGRLSVLGNPNATKQGRALMAAVDEARRAGATNEEIAQAAAGRATAAAQDFIPAPDGGLDYGEITPEMGKAMRRQAGKIRLRRGDETQGLVHIENRHNKDFAALGFKSAQDFVSQVASGFTKIYKGRGAALDVVLDDQARGMLIVSLEQSGDGDFYDIKTATPIRRDQFKNEEPLWDRAGPSASTADESSPPYPKGQNGADSVPTTAPEAQPEAPKLTPTEAKSLMAWEDLGQKDGVKTHALTFYESQADKDAKRGRMIVAKVSKGDRSATAWMVDGEDQTFGALAQAKKLAEEVGMAKAVADGFVEPAAAPASPQEGIAQAQANAARFEIGKSLTKEQRKQVLDSLVDVYKSKGAEREFKGQDGNGNDRYGYAHSPDLFEKSDITGAMVRYYVTLPDGRIAHPTELFPDVSASDIERMVLEQEANSKSEKAFENAIKPFYKDFDSANLMAVAGQVVISKGDRFAIIPDRIGSVNQARQQGWELAKTAAPVAKPAPAAPAAPITDFGEKIGGARKDVWSGFKDDLNKVLDDDIAGQPLTKVWPAPDYQKLIDAGMSAKAVAAVRALRDEVPAKPRAAWKVKRWAEQVKTLRGLANDVMDGKITVQDMERMGANKGTSLRGMMGRIELYELVGHEKSLEGVRFAHHHYAPYKGRENVSLWVVEKYAGASAFSNWPREIAIGDTKEQALAAFKEKYAGLDLEKAVRKAAFDIFSERGSNAFYVGKKIGRNYAKLEGPFDTVREAREYREKNLQALEAKLEKYKEIPRERADVNQPRVGVDMRNGQDVTPQMFGEVFGFRGVEFGNWVEQKRRQKDLNDAFDALMDMAAVLDIPPKAISLNGQLGLAFGARGSGGVNPAAAHYEPDNVVINLTKKEGAGSLGHEWWHALDNYFAKQRKVNRGSFMTTGTDVGLAARGKDYYYEGGIRQEMIDAFGAVVKAINLTAMKARASKLDSKRTKEYWTTGEEMSARAFESYLISKLQDQNASNDYLANVVSEKTWDAMAALGLENDGSYPYPTAAEIPAIRAGFDHFFQTVETRADDAGNVAMFSRVPPGLTAEEAVAMFNAANQVSPDARNAQRRISDARLVATQQLIDGLKAKWTRSPEIIVARNMQDAQIPQEVRDYDALLKSQGATGEPRGFIYQGKVYLLSDELKGPQQIAEVLFHEVLGHYGLRGAFGDSLNSILQQMGTMRRRDVVAKAREYGLFNKDALGGLDAATASDSQIWAAMSAKNRLSAAEEVLAEMAQSQPTIGFVQRAIAAIRNWLRANVPGFKNLKLTDADIVQAYILPARGYVTRSQETGAQSLERAMRDAGFSRTAGDQTQTENFRRWFAGSKVVDADGKPLVVYHGTRRNFDVFSKDATVANPWLLGNDNKHGFFFTTSSGGKSDSGPWTGAAGYAGTSQRDGETVAAEGANVMPVYLSLQIPYRMSPDKYRKSGGRESLRDELEALGYDGIIVGNPSDGNLDIVVFHPEQIKSAIGNNGNFDPEDDRINFSRSTEAAKAVGDAIKSVTVTNIKQRAGFKLTDYLGVGLQALGRRQIVDIYGDMLPLGEYNRLVQQMEADKNEGSAEADQLVNRWAKLEDEGKLADLMHDATLAQIDPAKPYVDGDDKARYMMLQGRFNALTDAAKQVYTDTRDSYQAHHAKVRSAIKERIERSEIKGERKAALLKQMDDEFFKAIKGVYFPLARFGQYAVTVKGPDGKVESVSRAETKAEAEALRNNLLSAFPRDNGFTVGRVMLSKDFIADRDAVGRGFMTELYQVLDQQNMDAAQRAELEDTLGQLYLSSLPDLSWAKHGIHRKGTPGFSQDARRAFAQNMFHGARYLAKLRYSDLMQDELAAMQKHVDDWREVEDFDQNSAQRVVDEMNKRHESLMNPKSNPLSTALTSLGFVFHLGLSPASAMVNLSQTALVAYPIMGAKWGFNKASAALLKASAEAAKGKNDITASLNADELAAYNEAVRAGTIDVTMAHDLAGIAQGEDAGVMWKIRPVMRYASFLFHHAERFNRQVTFVAAYRLAREAGADAKSAYEQATKATYDGHYDYSAANRPRIMQGNVAKVLLLFKQYGQNMVYTLARNAQQAINGESPEVRAQARKALGGLLATHAAAAGVLGLPMVTTLLAAASMIGGDDDEPWDAKVALQNMLADALGQKPAEVLAHGLLRIPRDGGHDSTLMADSVPA